MKPNAPAAVIEEAHRRHMQSLPFEDDADFRNADRGFLAALSPCVITAADGRVVWDNDSYAFLDGPAPSSVHPSLWRQSTLNAKQGLYEVVPGIYQVRGFDISNITFIEGDTGIIVIDPLISTEVAAAALALYRDHRGGERRVVAVIYTHSHADHFGGVLGVTSEAEVASGAVAVLAPEGFVEHAVQENVYAGTAMARRATYMYGTLLSRGPLDQVGCGLGQATSTGEVAIIVPTVDIAATGETHTIDGVEIAEMFQMPPALDRAWHTHGYYGSVSHNVKAVYQRYMGWFDGNPARLWPHPPEALGPRYVEAMGGIDRVVEIAQAAFDAGDLRWAATLLDHAVFTDSEHLGARALLADTLEQLAYGSENATWRNFFLTGATELRDGNVGTALSSASPTMFNQLAPEQIFDSLAIRVNGPRSWELDVAIDITFADVGANYRLSLRNGVLVYRKLAADPATATVTVSLRTKMRLLAAVVGDVTSPGLEISGDATALQSFLGVLDQPDPAFNIVTP